MKPDNKLFYSKKRGAEVVVFIYAFLFLWLLPLFAAADTPPTARKLEISYPLVPGTSPLTDVGIPLPEYIKYIYYFVMVVSGFIALLVIVIAGFRYVSSAGRPEEMKDAKNQIASALLGIVILFLSAVLIVTINPAWINFRVAPIPFPLPVLQAGVLLCSNAVANPQGQGGPVAIDSSFLENFYTTTIPNIENAPDVETRNQRITEANEKLDTVAQYCFYLTAGGYLSSDLAGSINQIFLIPNLPSISQPGTHYGVILGEEASSTKSAVFWASSDAISNKTIYHISVSDAGFSTIQNIMGITMDFQTPTGSEIDLFEQEFYNQHAPPDQNPPPQFTTLPIAQYETEQQVDNIFTPPDNSQGGMSAIGSLGVIGNLIAIFTKESASINQGAPPTPHNINTSEIDFFTANQDDLNNNRMGVWLGQNEPGGGGGCYLQREPNEPNKDYPCAKSLVVLSGSIF